MPLLDGTDFLSGNTICVFPDGKTKVWKAVNDASTYLMSMYSLSHQATFIKTDMLKKRPYREDLKVVSDWEQMFYELIIGDRTYKRLNLNICKFAQGGVSSTQAETRERERKIVLNEHFSKNANRYSSSKSARSYSKFGGLWKSLLRKVGIGCKNCEENIWEELIYLKMKQRLDYISICVLEQCCLLSFIIAYVGILISGGASGRGK